MEKNIFPKEKKKREEKEKTYCIPVLQVGVVLANGGNGNKPPED
jgi:hypothetical protein